MERTTLKISNDFPISRVTTGTMALREEDVQKRIFELDREVDMTMGFVREEA